MDLCSCVTEDKLWVCQEIFYNSYVHFKKHHRLCLKCEEFLLESCTASLSVVCSASCGSHLLVAPTTIRFPKVTSIGDPQFMLCSSSASDFCNPNLFALFTGCLDWYCVICLEPQRERQTTNMNKQKLFNFFHNITSFSNLILKNSIPPYTNNSLASTSSICWNRLL